MTPIKIFQFLIIFPLLILYGCATIPKETLDLHRATMKEAEQMHELNLKLLQNLYDDRAQALNDFYNTVYLPAFVKKVTQAIETNHPGDLHIQDSLLKETLVKLPIMTETDRNKIMAPLKNQYDSAVTRLNKDYLTFSRAEETTDQLLSSAIKVNQAWEKAKVKMEDITGMKLGTAEDKFNSIVGALGKSPVDFNRLQNTVDTILHNK